MFALILAAFLGNPALGVVGLLFCVGVLRVGDMPQLAADRAMEAEDRIVLVFGRVKRGVDQKRVEPAL
eukprot:11166407-Lingulodinium_polyedra.AAC.1